MSPQENDQDLLEISNFIHAWIWNIKGQDQQVKYLSVL